MSNITLTDINRLDFNLAVTFLAIWQERSVSKAAAKLSLSQSAVSAALTRLRETANDALFVRTRTGMEPTPRAIAMAGQIEQGVEILHQALRVDAGFDPGLSTQHFSIGMSDDFEVAIGPAISSCLLTLAPNVSVVFRQTNRHTVEQMLESREIDLAVVAGGPLRSGIVSEVIGTSGYACLLNNGLCEVVLPLSLEDFLALPHILISFSGREGIVDTGLKVIGQSRIIQTALTHFSSLPAYLRTMKAVATLPSHAAHTLAHVAGLSLSPVPIDLGTYEVRAVRRRNSVEDPAIEWLVTLIKQALTLPQD
jgi:DNA-binding transcriptional LysR family regulator